MGGWLRFHLKKKSFELDRQWAKLFIHLSTQLSVRSFVRSFIPSFLCSLTHSQARGSVMPLHVFFYAPFTKECRAASIKETFYVDGLF